MGLFDIFGKKSKSNLTPDTSYPTQEELYFTSPQASQRGYSLRDFASSRIRGENLGFGPDFIDRASSAPIKSREARFNEVELPQISSQLSSRGMARSAGAPGTASDAIIRAGQSKERDINDLIANLFTINEAQKKTDQSQALGLATGLQDQEVGMKNNQAAASERLSGRTAEQQRYNAAIDTERGNNIISGAATLIGGPTGASVSGLLSKLFPKNKNSSESYYSNETNLKASSAYKAKVLGNSADEDIIAELNARGLI